MPDLKKTGLSGASLFFKFQPYLRVKKTCIIKCFRANADDLMPLFEKYGDVGDIYFPLERGSGRSRGFAFVR